MLQCVVPSATATHLPEAAARRPDLLRRAILLCVLAAVGLCGWAVYEIRADRRARETEDWRVRAAVSAMDLQDTLIKQAIADRRAITGMRRSDVRLARGDPMVAQIGPEVSNALRALGTVEMWAYQAVVGEPMVAVCFGREGTVIYSTDEHAAAKLVGR